jgi:hypothetical protein
MPFKFSRKCQSGNFSALDLLWDGLLMSAISFSVVFIVCGVLMLMMTALKYVGGLLGSRKKQSGHMELLLFPYSNTVPKIKNEPR